MEQFNILIHTSFHLTYHTIYHTLTQLKLIIYYTFKWLTIYNTKVSFFTLIVAVGFHNLWKAFDKMFNNTIFHTLK